MRKLRKSIAVLIAAAVLLFARTGYLIVRPGTAEDLSQFVTVDEDTNKEQGTFYLVTVSQQRATPVLLCYALLHPDVDLLPSSSVIPPQMKRQEYNELMQQWMTESQNLAKVIALRRKGYEVPIRSDGVEVVEVEEDSPAKGLLIPEDVIVAVDGQPVYLAEELITKVQQRAIGDPVTLSVKRQGRQHEVEITTTNHTELPERAAIGVLIQTLNWQPVLPLEIKIDAGKISGPSAGLMFVLEIMNQLEERDLTAGHKIAGTGTINLKEEVGAIGGVRQKVKAAEKVGAEYFFVPRENYEEAREAAEKITLVAVSTLTEALLFLEDLTGEEESTNNYSLRREIGQKTAKKAA